MVVSLRVEIDEPNVLSLGGEVANAARVGILHSHLWQRLSGHTQVVLEGKTAVRTREDQHIAGTGILGEVVDCGSPVGRSGLPVK